MKETSVIEVSNPSELLSLLKQKPTKLIIKGTYTQEIHELMKNLALEYELMGRALNVSILVYFIKRFFSFFSPSDKKASLAIRRKLALYEVEKSSDNQLLLTIRRS